MKEFRVIIAGGGTGGHIFPAIAVGKALQRLMPGTKLLFVGAKGRMEMEKVPQAGFEIIGLDIAGFNRSNMLKNLTLPLKMLSARMKARKILKEFQPAAVVGVGGYASFPILNAAQSMKMPTLIQEQNSYAGRANRMLGKAADSVCVAYKYMDRFFPAEKISVTGNPVRQEISAANIDPAAAKASFSLDPSKKTVLVIGGSLGAKSINDTIDIGLDKLLKEGVQLIWQTGKAQYEAARQRAAGNEDKVVVRDFIKDMAQAYAAADVVVSRAGALAIAELCIAAKPVIFVPYPYAADDHQKSNAKALVDARGALMIPDDVVDTQLMWKLTELIKDEQKQKAMSASLKALAINDADERIAMKVIAIAKLN